MEDIAQLRKNAKALEPVVRIGKSGLSDSVISEIKKHLEQKRLIKIKMLRSFIGTSDKKAAAQQLADKTNSILVQRTGLVAVLAKK